MSSSHDRRRSEASPWPMVVAMLVASVGVHLVLWPLGDHVLDLRWKEPPPLPGTGIMEIALLEPDEDEPELEPDARRPEIPGQLVQPDRVLDERPPEQPTDKVSEFDSRVERETAAPNRPRARSYDPRQLGEQAGQASPDAQGSTEQDTPQHALPLGRLAPGDANDLGHRIEGELPVGEDGSSSDRARATAPRPGLRGTAEAMRKTFGGSGSFDSLPGTEDGTESLLNTDRFRFASFFNRVRDQVAQHWDPNGVMRRVDADGRVYGRRTRKTLLRIKLDPKGAITKIHVIGDSGVLELDKEAIRSFHQAAPFVNPPPEMVDATTGLIEFDFLFILDDGKASLRRYLR